MILISVSPSGSRGLEGDCKAFLVGVNGQITIHIYDMKGGHIKL
jgi:hypothetical protein